MGKSEDDYAEVIVIPVQSTFRSIVEGLVIGTGLSTIVGIIGFALSTPKLRSDMILVVLDLLYKHNIL